MDVTRKKHVLIENRDSRHELTSMEDLENKMSVDRHDDKESHQRRASNSLDPDRRRTEIATLRRGESLCDRIDNIVVVTYYRWHEGDGKRKR